MYSNTFIAAILLFIHSFQKVGSEFLLTKLHAILPVIGNVTEKTKVKNF